MSAWPRARAMRSVEHTKRYTTLGMATDQGKTSNINGLALLAEALGAEIPDVGTTTFRPPYTPISMGAIAGTAKGPLFKPVRQTPMHGWSDANGADWEPVGDWYRPFCYRRGGEDRHAAVTREVLNARQQVPRQQVRIREHWPASPLFFSTGMLAISFSSCRRTDSDQ